MYSSKISTYSQKRKNDEASAYKMSYNYSFPPSPHLQNRSLLNHSKTVMMLQCIRSLYTAFIRSPICCCMQEKRREDTPNPCRPACCCCWSIICPHTHHWWGYYINGLYSCTAAAADAHHTGQRIPPDTAGGLLSITSIEPSCMGKRLVYIYLRQYYTWWWRPPILYGIYC